MSDGDRAEARRRYGTFEGVFVPTILTILGVILFLRTGWVVGNAGLAGGLLVILVAFVIVGTTALSLASISSNVTPAAGGAYAIVARSFGVEAGGAVGVPLYLSQTLVVVLYTFGFRDGWLSLFPNHPALAVDLALCATLVVVTLVSTRAAFRVQYLILAVVAAALLAVAVAALTEPLDRRVPLIGTFPGSPDDGFGGTDVWRVFGVFFPATTGIMAGLNLSGELRDPRRSILRGTLAAVALSLVVYVAVAVWLGFTATTEELVANYFVLIDRAAWPPVVLAGLLAATFSSALASLVGAPRILQALAEHKLLPASAWLERRDARGEPRRALAVTIAIVAVALLLRELNTIAPLITLVFLAAYAAINLSVLTETLVGLTSYRPAFRVPLAVPLLGAVGCLAAMFVVHAGFTLLALLLMTAFLVWLGRRPLERPVSDVRSGALRALARWATRKAAEIHSSDERGWTPHLLALIRGEGEVERVRDWVTEVANPTGAARFAVVGRDGTVDELHERVSVAARGLRQAGLEASTMVVDAGTNEVGALASLHAVGRQEEVWAPNVIIAPFPDAPGQDAELHRLLREAYEQGVGVVLTPEAGPPAPGDVAGGVGLWLDGRRHRWQIERHLPRSDLALLVAYQIARNSGRTLKLLTAVGDAGAVEAAEAYLHEIVELARLPESTEIRVIEGPFPQAVGHASSVALHVHSLSPYVDFDRLRAIRDASGRSCLFVRDSGIENAFA